MTNPTALAFGATDIDIEALARKAAAGDPIALDALLAAVRPETLRLCGRFLPNREDAEEACQDTLWAVARGIGQFRGGSAFRTWLYRLAGTRLDLLDALESLAPEQAEAAVLRDVLGLSYGDVATLLDIPEGTVKSRIHEARRRLRLRMGDSQ
jgi:RNA polymerase sigma-70 factor (ECF subfamily)